MKSPRPCSYHQNETAVATRRASSERAIRLRSSVRCATRLIVAAASRGGLRRRARGAWPASLTVVLSGTEGSARAVVRAGPIGAGAEFGGADLGGPGLLVQLGSQVATGRGYRRNDLTAQGRRRGGVLAADVVVLHALHLALEDAQRTTEGPCGVRQLLVTEEQQDRQDDQYEFRRAESEHETSSRFVAPAMLRRRGLLNGPLSGEVKPAEPGRRSAGAARAAAASRARRPRPPVGGGSTRRRVRTPARRARQRRGRAPPPTPPGAPQGDPIGRRRARAGGSLRSEPGPPGHQRRSRRPARPARRRRPRPRGRRPAGAPR